MMCMELSNFDPAIDRRFRWNYSYKEILDFYNRKQKIFFDRFTAARDCVISLVNGIFSAMNGKREEGAIEKDTGEGLEDLTDEQILEWKEILSPEEFADMFKDFDLSDLGIDLDNLHNSDNVPRGGTSLCSDGSDSLEGVE